MTRAFALAVSIVSLTVFGAVNSAQARTPEEAKAACDAKGSFYKLLPAHKAGEINARTGAPFKKDSSGTCRMDTAKVKEAIAGGQLKAK
jgi:hypothetical protein